MNTQKVPSGAVLGGMPGREWPPLFAPGHTTSNHLPGEVDIPREWAELPTGLTGTRRGATADQQAALLRVLAALWPSALHHGMCRGADTQGGAIAGCMGIRRVGHPPIRTSCMGVCEVEELRKPAEFLDRDRSIVDETGLLLVVPFTFAPIPRGSGTWYTARYAHKRARPRVFIYPDGTVLPQPPGATAWLARRSPS